jgi:hypothetical protein
MRREAQGRKLQMAESGLAVARVVETKGSRERGKRKRANLAAAPDFAALGPIPTIPGGWGLRNPKPKGPGQRSAFFSQFRRAGEGRKWGGIMIPANDTVTVKLDNQPHVQATLW